jgi:hypothetical protein
MNTKKLGAILGILLTFGYAVDAIAANEPINNQSNTVITGNALADSKGIIAINQASGIDNTQANSVSIVIGTNKPLNNSVLAQNDASTPVKIAFPQSKNLNVVAVGATAFRGAEGIVQLNQVAGVHNTSANSFALGIAPGVIR